MDRDDDARLAPGNTLLVALNRHLSDKTPRGRHIELAVDQMMFLLAGCRDRR